MRLAYLHFFEGKSTKKFADFLLKAHGSYERFTISNVVDAIRENLELPAEKPLFIFLHTDEYQSVFSFNWHGAARRRSTWPVIETGKARDQDHAVRGLGEEYTEEGLGLFREMMRCLGSFMSGEIKPNMIQTFLSGTARHEVAQLSEPTFYSFSFLECPTLSLGACYDVMGHFVEKANKFNNVSRVEKVSHSDWMPKMAYFHFAVSHRWPSTRTAAAIGGHFRHKT